MKGIRYRKGYKYQLTEDYTVNVGISPEAAIDTDYIDLATEGNLTIRKGYAWDGPSGPTIDTTNFMRGSVVHDALYQLMREGLLDHTVYRTIADRVLVDCCREDGMSSIRARTVYLGVYYFADTAANPTSRKFTLKAPV